VSSVTILHRAADAARPRSDEVVWRTCLRDIVFDPAPAPAASAGVYHDAGAYAFLLEVICGLHSPIVGETQVMGQFKAFLTGLDRSQAELRRLGQHLLTDARRIRETYLIALGSRTYGSAVRRHLGDCRRVGLIGSGQLAAEIRPFLESDGRTVDHWGRRFDEAAPRLLEAATLIVAAPIDSAGIARVAARYASLTRIIDLRGEAFADPVTLDIPLVTLADVFAEVSAANARVDARVREARVAIADCAARQQARADLRPSGWHDLCA
jgi:glutamyl-tRNA reductase